MSTVLVTAGAIEYRGVQITETTGKDISGDTCAVALVPWGSTPVPGDFVSPDDIGHPSPSVVQLKMLISATTQSKGVTVAPGSTYSLWGKITDSPEVEPLKSPEQITIA